MNKILSSNSEPSLHRVLHINTHWGSFVFLFSGAFRAEKYVMDFDKIM